MSQMLYTDNGYTMVASRKNFGQFGPIVAYRDFGDFGSGEYGVVFPQWAAKKSRMAQCPDMAASYAKYRSEKAKWKKTGLIGDRQERLAIRSRAKAYRVKGKTAWKTCKTELKGGEEGGGFVDTAAQVAAAALMPMGTEMDPGMVDTQSVGGGADDTGRTLLLVGVGGLVLMGGLVVLVKSRKKAAKKKTAKKTKPSK